MIEPENINIVYSERLERQNGVKKNGTGITEIVMESGRTFREKMFIDASYEGDLMEQRSKAYTVGRESNSQYGETLNGVQANKTSLTLRGTISRMHIIITSLMCGSIY
jgi:hypothetical protein